MAVVRTAIESGHSMTRALTVPLQGLLGVFFKIEAVALFEDIEPALRSCDGDNCKGELSGVEYFAQDDVTAAYSKAA